MLGKVIVNDEAGVCGFAYRGAMAALGRRVKNIASSPAGSYGNVNNHMLRGLGTCGATPGAVTRVYVVLFTLTLTIIS